MYIFLYFSLLAADIHSVFRVGHKNVLGRGQQTRRIVDHNRMVSILDQTVDEKDTF